MKVSHHYLWRQVQGAWLLLLCALFLFPGGAGAAVDAQMQWVETEVALAPNGKAMVQYKVHWKVNSGTMGGFYFQGERGRIQWQDPGCGAVVDGQNRYSLDLRNLGTSGTSCWAAGRGSVPGKSRLS